MVYYTSVGQDLCKCCAYFFCVMYCIILYMYVYVLLKTKRVDPKQG